MAVRSVVLTDLLAGRLSTWSGLLNGDTGEPLEATEFADRAVQVSGTFGAGGSCALEGSNDNVTWNALNDPQGTPIAFTASKIEQVLETPRYIRPNVTAGDGTTSLTMTAFGRRLSK